MNLRRSVLYVPGNNPRALEKSRNLPVDCVVFDLEDSVGPDDKNEARDRVSAALHLPNTSHQERVVRINGLQSDWVGQDVATLKQSNADAVLLPKIKTADDIHVYRDLFGGHANHHPAFWIMAETAAGISNMSEIITADTAIAVIVMGLEDIALETRIRYTPSREGYLYVLSACLITARAHGLDIIDGVYTALNDMVGFKAECEQATVLGFDGKSLIHPGQIDVCNKCFSPSYVQIQHAQTIIKAWDEQQEQGRSVAVVNGRMIEHLHVSEARRVQAIAKLISSRS